MVYMTNKVRQISIRSLAPPGASLTVRRLHRPRPTHPPATYPRYDVGIVPLLSSAVKGLLRPGGRFYYVAPATGRAGLPEFLGGLVGEWGFERVAEEEAPDAYKENPLANGDDAEALLHFTELSTGGYRLHTFVRV